MMRKFLLFFICFQALLNVNAEENVKLVASGPATVFLGRPFQISYTANSKVSDFKAPAITNFDILAGPYKSESYSSQIINGNVSSSVSISFTYTLQAQKTGTFSIPSAYVTVDGNKISSTGINIKVLPDDGKGNAGQGGSGSSGGLSSSAGISSQNIFIKPVLSRNSVYEQEAIKLSYKLYTTYDIVQYNTKLLPEFNGFLKQEFDRTGNTQLDYENYNGKNFLTAVLYEVMLYPQSAGEITIDKASFEAIIRVQSRQQVRSIFDDFFETYSNVAKKIDVPSIKLNVKPLPSGKPNGFYGLTGQFSLNANISSSEVKVNEGVTIKINIAGNGNLKLLKNPEFDFPESFEAYDPKVSNNFKTSSSGITGNKTVEIIFIPRHSGAFEIPSVEIPYFDPAENKYKILKTPVYNLQVLKADGSVDQTPVVNNFTAKEDVKQIGNDIRYIYTGKIILSDKNEVFLITNWLSYLMYLIPLLLSVIFYLIFRKQVKENADIVLSKNKKANKMATKRLKIARQLLQAGNREKFYEEVIKALWTYLSDKLNIPVSELNKDNVNEVLNEKGVEKSIIMLLNDILNTCEFARYAPPSEGNAMGGLYEKAIEIISTLEGVLKNKLL